MKKILSYVSLAITGLLMAACSEDFKDWATQQTYPQDEAITIPGFTASATGNIDLNVDEPNMHGGNVALLTLSETALPEGFTLQGIRADITPASVEGPTVQLKADANGMFSVAELQQLIEDAYGKRPVSRLFNAHVYASAINDGQAALIDAGTIQLNLIPKAPQISDKYYIIGGPNDWAGSAAERSIVFTHSDKDVYEDPVFTVIFDAAAEGDTWFAIGDDKACDAIGNGDWNQLFGIVGGNSQSTEGKLDRRYNLGGDNSFCVPAGATKIKVTIDMMEYSFRVEQVNIAEAYYLIGGPGNWDNSKNQKFSHSSQSVIDDPVFTYVFAGSGSDMWFAFGDDEAIDAVGEGVWNKLFGTTGASEDLSGTFDRRYNLDGDHSFHVDGQAKFYRFQINMAEMSYTITTLNFDPFIYFIGATDGWANAEQKLALTDESGIYTGYLYCADPNGWGNEFKFQRVPGDWGTELNTGTFASGISGDFEGGPDGGSNIKATAGEGVYYVTLNMGSLTLNAVKINNMNLVGDFNGWNAGDDAQQMTWDAANFCYVITGAGVTANGWKFTTNNSWDINLGGDTLDDLVANGPNISAVGTTIKLYPTRKNSDKIFCTVE